MTNYRLTFVAGLAVAASSLSLFAVLHGTAWLVAGLGAIVAVAIAGSLTRLGTAQAAIAAAVAVLIASVPLLTGHGWAGLIGGLALIAGAGASATGNRLARGYAMLATYCSCLLTFLNAAFASGASFVRLIPTAKSVELLTKLPSQATPRFQYSPPIVATRPVDFIAAAGVGGIAIIVDILAVRLRRPALAGLPLLLLFSVPVASNLKGFGIDQFLTFGAGLSAYLTLLSTDGRQRLRMWGRLVSVRRIAAEEAGAGPDTKDMAATGRRVGLAAVCLAIVVPLALPNSKPHDIFSKSDNGTGAPGLGSLATGIGLSPFLDVQRQLSLAKPKTVLTYTTTSKTPQEQYLQTWVSNYDAHTNSWSVVGGLLPATLHSQLPAEIPGLAAGEKTDTVTTTITTVDQPGAQPLELPYAPVSVSVAGGGSALEEAAGSLMVYDQQQRGHLTYTVTSREAEPALADLSSVALSPTEIMNSYTGYRGPDASALLRIAKAHTAGAITPLQVAVKLQNWLTSSQFRYTLNPNLPKDSHWLLAFLTKDRRGDCQQFSTAFAVLARLLGYPTRIATGYTAGTSANGKNWIVTTADSHAWPEMFFPSVGWVRFEPTPGGTGGQGTAVAPLYTVGTQDGAGSTNPNLSNSTPGGNTSKGAQLNKAKLHTIGLGGGSKGAAGGKAARKAPGFPVGLTVLAVLALLLVSPALGRWLTRRRRWLGASGDAALASTAWRELLDDLTDYGIASLPSESPRATVRRVSREARLAPAPRDALARIGSAEERARYSLRTQPGIALRSDLAMVRRAIADRASRSQRMRAMLLPPSTLAAASRGLQSLSRATGWIDTSWPTMRRQFRQAVLHRAS